MTHIRTALARSLTRGGTAPVIGLYAACRLLPLPPAAAAACLFTLALHLIFISPGINWVPLFSRDREIPLSGFLARSFGLNLCALALLTTLIKAAGFAVSAKNLLPAILLFAFIGEYLRARKGASVSIRNDLAPHWPVMAAAVCACLALLVCFRHYFLTPLDRYWLLDDGEGMRSGMIVDWKFPGKRLDPPRFDGGANVRAAGGGRFEITGSPAALGYDNRSATPREVNLIYFLQMKHPARVSLSLNGKPIRSYDVVKSYPLRTDYFTARPCRQSIMEWVKLAPGRNVVEIRLAPFPVGVKAVLDDFSGCDKVSFVSAVRPRYQLVRLGPMFDAIEALDFGSNLRRKLFTYTWDIRQGVAAYTIITPPLDFFMDSLVLALMGDDLVHIKLLYLGKILFLFLCAWMLLVEGLPAVPRPLALLAVFAIAAETMVLAGFRYVETVDTLLAITYLLSAYFLWQRRYGWFVLFASFASLTRFHGALFPMIFLAVFAMSGRVRWSRALKCAAVLGAVLAVYAAGALIICVATHVLNIWAEDVIYGHLIRFEGKIMEPCRTPLHLGTFAWWMLLASCFSPLFFLLKRDGLGRVLFRSAAPYFALMCASSYVKVYYLIVPLYPFIIIAARSIAGRAAARGGARLTACALVLAAGAVVFMAVAPLTDPDFNSVFPGLYHRLVSAGLLPRYGGLY